jgi:hypothetical protein
MLHLVAVYLTSAAFAAAGIVNIAGRPSQKASFVRWGYPAWWCRVTGVLEIIVAVLTVLPARHGLGLSLGAAVIAVAGVTLLRHREFAHLAPVGVYVTLLRPAAFNA